MPEFNLEVDARGLNCPLPILRAKKAIQSLSPGNVLKIRSTDPGSVKDFQAFCNQTGNKLLSSMEQDSEYVFMIHKN